MRETTAYGKMETALLYNHVLKLAALRMMLALCVSVFPHFKIYVSMWTEVLCVCTYMCVCTTILSKSFAPLTNSVPAESERKGRAVCRSGGAMGWSGLQAAGWPHGTLSHLHNPPACAPCASNNLRARVPSSSSALSWSYLLLSLLFGHSLNIYCPESRGRVWCGVQVLGDSWNPASRLQSYWIWSGFITSLCLPYWGITIEATSWGCFETYMD